MCGGAIIADFIPRRDGRRLTASELWPNSFGQQIDSSNFGFSHTAADQQPPSTLKRSQPPKGELLFSFSSPNTLFIFLNSYLVQAPTSKLFCIC